RQGGLAHAGRAPENHRMRPTRLERHPQRFALSQQVGLPHDLVEVAWPQPLRQGRIARALRSGRKQITHGPGSAGCPQSCGAYSIRRTSTPLGASNWISLWDMSGLGTMAVISTRVV